jgi:hypothetical protein
MAALKLEVATQADVLDIVSVYFTSFQNAFALSAFPDVPSVRKWWTDMLESEFKDENAVFLKVVDSETGAIVAFAKWNKPVEGQEPEMILPAFAEGTNRKTCEDLLPKLAAARKEIMGTRGHWCMYSCP